MVMSDWKCHSCGCVSVSFNEEVRLCYFCGSDEGHPADKECHFCRSAEAEDHMRGRFADEVRRMES